MPDTHPMPEPRTLAPKPYKVLTAIDVDVLDVNGAYSLKSNTVLERALTMVSREGNAELHLVTVMRGNGATVDKNGAVAHVGEDLAKLVHSEIAELTKKGAQLRIGRVITHVLHGSAADEIVWLAARLSADVIVVGSHGRKGLERLLVGSVAQDVVRQAGCPVFVVRSKQHDATWTTPEIEPPCKLCLEARAASARTEMWCTRHMEHHARAHTYADNTDAALSGVAPWGFTD